MSNPRPINMTAGAIALRDWKDRRGLNQREAAKVLGVHYMCLNQYLLGRRLPGLAVALRIEREAGVSAGLWTRTVVSGTRKRKAKTNGNDYKHAAYGHAS